MSVQIRLESKGGKHSSLMFCTNGVLLRKLVGWNMQNNSEDTTNEAEEFTGLDATHVIVVSLVSSRPFMETQDGSFISECLLDSYNQQFL